MDTVTLMTVMIMGFQDSISRLLMGKLCVLSPTSSCLIATVRSIRPFFLSKNVRVRTEFWQSYPQREELLPLKEWKTEMCWLPQGVCSRGQTFTTGVGVCLNMLHMSWCFSLPCICGLMQIFSVDFATESKAEYVPKWHISPLIELAKKPGEKRSVHLKKVQKLAFLQCFWCVIGKPGTSTRCGQTCSGGCGERHCGNRGSYEGLEGDSCHTHAPTQCALTSHVWAGTFFCRFIETIHTLVHSPQ